jgi:DNA primase catalytic core
MARIPDEQIDRLKQEVSLVHLVERQGITLKKHGKDYLGLCPFHDDKEPSLVISPDKNLWHCLGACQSGGTVIDWVMKAEGVNFRRAVELLQADSNPSLVADSGPTKCSRTKKQSPPLNASAEDQALLMQVVDYYHETLKGDAEGVAYLEKRGISAEAIEHFKLGLANRTLGYRLPEKTRKAGAEIRGRLQGLGILRQSGHEHFNGSVVIPVINDGEVLELYGRKLGERLRKGTPLHLYLPGPHRGVFNLEALKSSKEIILCESLIDALTFWSAGYRNVTASYGIEGFTAAHLKALRDHNTGRVLIAYDRDAAGEAASEKRSKQLMAEGIDCYRIQFPKGMDANEYACQVKPANKSLGVVIRSAVWLGKGEGPSKLGHQQVNEAPESFEPLPAKVIPEPPKPDIPAEVKEDEVIIAFGDRRYRVRGLDKNLVVNQLKVNLLVSKDEAIHVDSFDLYAAKARYSFIRQASIELGVSEAVIKKDLGRVLLKCESLQAEQIQRDQSLEGPEVELDDQTRNQALALLKAPDLLDRILADFETCGVVGEESNKLVGYLAAVSRKLDKPLAVIIQSSSAAGKSSLMDAVLNLMPEEERVQYSAMTGQSLFYMGETNLKHKILAIAEEEGAEQASYALKLLQSEGELTIASTGKDESTGTLVTKAYRVEGPVMLFLTTTAIDIDEELMNRCLVLTVNESREQTQAIHALQRQQQTLEGLLRNEDKKQLIQLHRNAQRLLRPLLVANPFAEQLTFIDDKTRTRRDHMKYLTLIRAIALLHQYQREIKSVEHQGQALEYIEVIPQDIAMANRLAHDVLGRSLEELPPQTSTLLKKIREMVVEQCKQQGMEQSDYRFSRREVRNHSGWTDFQVKKHMTRLQELEYVLVHRGRRGQSFVYELLYQGEGEDGKAFLLGLSDPEKLRSDAKKERPKQEKESPRSPQVVAKAPLGSGVEKAVQPSAGKACGKEEPLNGQKKVIKPETPSSYRTHIMLESPNGTLPASGV